MNIVRTAEFRPQNKTSDETLFSQLSDTMAKCNEMLQKKLWNFQRPTNITARNVCQFVPFFRLLLLVGSS